MSRYDGEDMAWDGGPPGAESDPIPQHWGSVVPPSKGIVQMAYSSYLPQTRPSNVPFGCTGDDFLYTTPAQSTSVSGPPTQHSDKKETNSYPRSRRSPLPLHSRHNSNKSYTKHSRSRSKSPKRHFKKSRSRSLSKGKSTRNYRKPQSFNESKSYNYSRKQRKFSSSSSDSSDRSDRSKSNSRSLPKERIYKHNDNPTRSGGKIIEFENEKIQSKKPSKNSRSPSPESSSSKSSNFSERHYNNHSKSGQSLISTPKFQTKRQNNSSPEPSGSDSYYKGQRKPNKSQSFRANYKNTRRGNFSGASNPRPQSKGQHSNYPPVSNTYQAPPAAAPFRNDGSFLEMFKKMQESQKAELETASTTVPELEKAELKKPALPMVGKRRGGRVLKTGMVKKPKSIEEQTVDNTPTDAWSLYLKEVKKYKDSSCDEECKMRPLFK